MISVIAITTVAALFAAIGAFNIKLGANKIHKYLNFKEYFNKYLFMGALFYLIGSVILIVVLKTNEISYIYPITASTYIFGSLMGHFFLNEKIDKIALTGLVIIVLGIVVMHL